MKKFDEALAYVDKLWYVPNRLIVESVREEAQNSEYGAGGFRLNSRSVRFRVAKITPAKSGQFVFPKEVLLRQNILRTASAKGKMAIRVYPEWENPTSRQAVQTQKWQLEYFVGMDAAGNSPRSRLLELYAN
ncbi:MepB family protein [Saccharibacillus deserti]|uniref:MepB family protein n=1 Tax=Saccharibacillus deserti TaxID=1634444 RepID=UPI00155247F3